MQRILIIEPDRSLGQTLYQYFSKNYIADLSRNSQSAIIKADKNRPDLIILELAMPKHNGIAFLQEFKSYTDWTNIPVVIYSHIPLEDTGLTEGEWSNQGVASYLYKPTTTLDALGERVEQNL